MFDTDHELPPAACPVCGYVMDRHAGGREPPKPGDLGVGLKCAAALEFTADMRLVVCDDPPAELRPTLARIRAALAEMRRHEET